LALQNQVQTAASLGTTKIRTPTHYLSFLSCRTQWFSSNSCFFFSFKIHSRKRYSLCLCHKPANYTSILNPAVSSVWYLCIYNFPQVAHLRGYATFGLVCVVTLPARSSTNETRL